MGCTILTHSQITDDFSEELQETEFQIRTVQNGVECLQHTLQYQKLCFPDEENPLACSINEMNKSQLFESLKSNTSTPQSKKSCLKQSSNLSLSKYQENKKVHFESHASSGFQPKTKKHKKKRRRLPEKINLDEIF